MKDYLITFGFDDTGEVYLDNFYQFKHSFKALRTALRLQKLTNKPQIRQLVREELHVLAMIKFRGSFQHTRAILLKSTVPLDRETVECWLRTQDRKSLVKKSVPTYKL